MSIRIQTIFLRPEVDNIHLLHVGEGNLKFIHTRVSYSLRAVVYGDGQSRICGGSTGSDRP